MTEPEEAGERTTGAENGGPGRRADTPRPRPLVDSILRLLWRERAMSRADIARRAEVSRSTVSEIVNILLPTGLIAETGAGPSRGGRRPIVLEFQDNAAAILGVEMGASHVDVALINLRGDVLSWQDRAHPVREDPEGTRRLMVELCDAALADWAPGINHLLGVGVAVPCPVDPARPDRLSSMVLPAWQGKSGLREVFARYRGVPVLIDNDANLGALSEQWWGAGQGVDNFAYVKVATGIGSGHVIDGRIYRGSSGVAGEIGHVSIDPDGDRCICGLRGCLTTLVGTQAIVKRARAMVAAHPGSLLAKEPLTIEAIEAAAIVGDPVANLIVVDAAEHLGKAIAGLLNIMNPAMVILGGGLTRVGDRLINPIRQTVRERTLLSSVSAAKIVASRLGPRTVAVGAATAVLQAALNDSTMFPEAAPQEVL